MFVSVIYDCADEDHKEAVRKTLKIFGFTERIKDTFETATISESSLLRLKRELDKAIDYYDSLRFYQFPMDGTLVITALMKKKWKRITVKDGIDRP
jgi:CRISPR-associated protein Cas2